MCGIAGIYYFRDATVDLQVLRRMGSSLAHRGPDESGFYTSTRIGLAHRRLKIIDLSSAAAQPMKDESSQYVVIFNGEIYNFKELRKELESKFRFFSQSDTEVILRGFQQKRERIWADLNGMFAIALADSSSEELHLVRDFAGVKPLYIYNDSEKLLFASEIKGIFASGLVLAEIDSEAIAAYLRLGYFAGAATPYRNIRKLLPGTNVRIHRNGVETQAFWKYRDHMQESRLEKPERRLDAALNDAVSRQMISDVPVGAFLSGGVDSSFIVALMSRLREAPVKTFTAGFPNMGYYDERPYAAAVAKVFRAEHYEFTVTDRLSDLVQRFARAMDEPFADSSSIPTSCIAELARQHVTVALSGTGGDEIFGGYRKYMAAHWLGMYSALPRSVRSAIRKAAHLLPGSRKTMWQERVMLLQRFADLPPDAFQINTIFSAQETEQLVGSAGEPRFEPVAKTVAGNMMLFDFESYLPEDLLVKEDRCTMMFGLEARVPFLDRDVVELMASLPIQYKVSAGSTKRLFKKVAAKYLPAEIVKRPKHGFGSPAAEWLRKDLREMTNEVLFSPNAFLKSSIIRKKFDEHQKGSDHSRALWAAFMLELWTQSTDKHR